MIQTATPPTKQEILEKKLNGNLQQIENKKKELEQRKKNHEKLENLEKTEIEGYLTAYKEFLEKFKNTTQTYNQLKQLEDQIDNNSNISKYKQKIDSLQKKIEEYKETYESIKQNYQSEIQQLDENLTKNIENLESQISSQLNDLKNNIQKNKQPKTFLGKAWQWTTEKLGQGRERAKNNKETLVKVGLGLGVGYLAYRGIRRAWRKLFGKKDAEKNDTDKDSDKKGFWDKRYGKLIKRTGIGTAAYMVYKRIKDGLNPLEMIKKWRASLRGKTNPKNNPSASHSPIGNPDALSEASEELGKKNQKIIETYNTLGQEANEYYQSSGAELDDETKFGGSIYEKGLEGTTFYALSGYGEGTFGSIVNEGFFLRQDLGQDIFERIGKFKNRGIEKLKKFIANTFGENSSLSRILNAKNVDEVLNKLKNSPDQVQQLKVAYGKNVRAVAFLQTLENNYRKKLEDQGLTEDEINQKIEELRKLKLVDFDGTNITNCAYLIFKNNGLFSETLQTNDDAKEKIETLDEKQNDRLETIENRKQDLNNNETIDIDDYNDLIDEVIEQIEVDGKESRRRKFVFFSGLFRNSDELVQNLYNNSDYKQKVEERINQLKELKNKNPVTQNDLNQLKTIVENSINYQKQIELTTTSMEETVNQHGDLVLRFFIKRGDNLKETRDFVIDKDHWHNKGDIAKSLLLIGGNGLLPLYIIKHPGKTIKFVGKATGKIIGQGGKLSISTIRDLVRAKGYYFKGDSILAQKLLQRDLLAGRISLQKAVRIAQKGELVLGNNPIENEIDLLKKLFGVNEDNAQKLAKIIDEGYLNNSKIQEFIFRKKYVNGTRYKPKDRFKWNKSKRKITVNEDNLNFIDKIINKKNIDSNFLKGFLKNIKTIDKDYIFNILNKFKSTSRYPLESIASNEKQLYKLGKYFGKYQNKISKLNNNEFDKLFDALKKSEGKNFKNIFKGIEEIEQNGKKITRFNPNKIRKLNESVEGISESAETNKVKGAMNRLIKSLETKAENPRFKSIAKRLKSYVDKLENGVKNLNEKTLKLFKNKVNLKNITPEYDSLLKALGEKEIEELKKLKNMIKTDDNFAKQLYKSKDIDEFKTLLKTKGIEDITKNNLLSEYLFKNRNITKLNKVGAKEFLDNTIDVALNYKELSVFGKIMKNPTTRKMFGLLGKSVPVIFGAFEAWGYTKEANEIKNRNPQLSKTLYRKAGTTMGLRSLESILLLLGPESFGISVAISGAIEGVNQVLNIYYDVVEEYKKNAITFSKKNAGYLKNTLLSMLASKEDIDVSTKEHLQELIGTLPGAFDEKKKDQRFEDHTKKDLIKALIYTENPSKYPLVFIPKNQLDTDSQAEQQKQKEELNKEFDIRYQYINKFLSDPAFLDSDNFLNSTNPTEQLDKLFEDSYKFYKLVKNNNITDINGLLNSLDTKTGKFDSNKIESLFNIDSDGANEISIDDLYNTKYIETLKDQDLITNLKKLETHNPDKFRVLVSSLDNMKNLLDLASNADVDVTDNNNGNQQNTIDDETLTNDQINTLKTKIEIIEKYYNIKYGGIPTYKQKLMNIPIDKTDFNSISKFLLNGKIDSLISNKGIQIDEINDDNIDTIGFESDIELADIYGYNSSPGTNVLYAIAKYGGYTGANQKEDIITYFKQDGDERQRGIYYENGTFNKKGNIVFSGYEFSTKYLRIPIIGMSITTAEEIRKYFFSDRLKISLEDLDKKESLEKIKNFLEKVGIVIKTKLSTYKTQLSQEATNNMKKIVSEQINLLNEQDKYKQQLRDYIKDNSKGKYIKLNSNAIIGGLKRGLKNLGLYVYKYENGKIVAYETPRLSVLKKQGINIEPNPIADETKLLKTSDTMKAGPFYIDFSNLNPNQIELNNEYYQLNSSYKLLDQLIKVDNGDLNVSEDIKILIKNLYTEAMTYRASYGKDINKIQTYNQKFENIYTKILLLASDGGTNNVNSEDYFKIFESVNTNYLGINYIWNTQKSDEENINEIKKVLKNLGLKRKYRDTFEDLAKDNSILTKLKDPNQTNKTIFEIVKSILEASTLLFDNNGNIEHLKNAMRRGTRDSLLEKRIKKNLGININT